MVVLVALEIIYEKALIFQEKERKTPILGFLASLSNQINKKLFI